MKPKEAKLLSGKRNLITKKPCIRPLCDTSEKLTEIKEANENGLHLPRGESDVQLVVTESVP